MPELEAQKETETQEPPEAQEKPETQKKPGARENLPDLPVIGLRRGQPLSPHEAWRRNPEGMKKAAEELQRQAAFEQDNPWWLAWQR